MKHGIPKILEENRQAILDTWRDDLKDKFGQLKEDSSIWLDRELEELFDGIAEKLAANHVSAAESSSRSEELNPELLDSMEFASRIECLVGGMRSMINCVGDLCRRSDDVTDQETESILGHLEASLRLQLHDEVESFCRRRRDKAALDHGSKAADRAAGDLTPDGEDGA